MRYGLITAGLFVLLWSTGFLGGKMGLPYAGPMTFLALRFGIVAVVLATWAILTRREWLRRDQIADQILIGALVHSLYLGGVFAGLAHGVEAGVAAMIVGLQPIATALVARQFLGERLVPVQWLGMMLGLTGVGLVIARQMESGFGDPLGVLFCFSALIGIAFGSILQKSRSDKTPMVSGNVVQFMSGTACCAILALIFEDMTVEWSGEFVFALGWLIIVLSLGAVALLYWLIQRGAASEVASLFFLVPPCTAVFAWLLFDEPLGLLKLVGMAITAIGVLLVNRKSFLIRRAAV
jgi:drug/metabolite transporter (DMT)-like permease